MTNTTKQNRIPVSTIRAWRESLGLSRPQVANIIRTLRPSKGDFSQATLAKWESGETDLRVNDLRLLAEIYGTTADRLLFEPGDNVTPDLLKRAHEIVTTKDPAAVNAWLESGQFLPTPSNLAENGKDKATN